MAVVINGNGAVTGLTALPDSAMAEGSVIQVKQTVKKDVFSASLATGNVSADITGLSVTITPTSSTNKILLIPTITTSAYVSFMFIYKNGSLLSEIGNDSGDSSVIRTTFGVSSSIFGGSTGQQGMLLDTAGSTSAITYSIRVQTSDPSTQTVYVNRAHNEDGSSNPFNTIYARYISTFTAMEVSA